MTSNLRLDVTKDLIGVELRYTLTFQKCQRHLKTAVIWRHVQAVAFVGTVDGAVAMLATRTTYLSDDWNDYQQFRINREQTRLHQTLKT